MFQTLLIDNYDSYTYLLFQYLWKLSGHRPLVLKNDELSIEEISALHFENIVISPGPGTVTQPKDIGICRQLLEKFPDKPVLGVCLGQQLIGHFFGGRIVHAPQPMHGKYSKVKLVPSPLFEGLPDEIEVVRYHSLLLERDSLPDCLRIIGETAEDRLVMAVQHQERPWFGVQFHPESIGTQGGETIIRNFLRLSGIPTFRSELSGSDLKVGVPETGTPTFRSELPGSDLKVGVPETGTPTFRSELPGSDLKVGVPKSTRKFTTREATWLDPDTVFATCFLKKKFAFWLDSSLVGENGRFSFMGCAARKFEPDGSFDFLEKTLADHRIAESEIELPFKGGWVGYLGYEGFRQTGEAPLPYPQSRFFWVEKFIAFDHRERKMYCCAVAEKEAEADGWFRQIERKLAAPKKGKNYRLEQDKGSFFNQKIEVKSIRQRADYLQDIVDIQQLIKDGESYEVCLTNEFQMEADLEPFHLYRVLRLTNPAPYSAYFQMPEACVISSSPECFFTLQTGGHIKSEPIKGTRPTGNSPEETAQIKAALLNSPKDHSELLMIIDLMRNDLSMICQPGSVEVRDFIKLTEYATLMQTSSLIEGQLLPGVSAVEVLKKIFPGGSITGAPKIRTMNIIERFEQRRRGIYTGSMGYFSLDGAAEFNIAIRTMVYDKAKKRLSFGSGGAILAESVPEEEYEEILVKAYALVRAVHLAKFGAFENYRLEM